MPKISLTWVSNTNTMFVNLTIWYRRMMQWFVVFMLVNPAWGGVTSFQMEPVSSYDRCVMRGVAWVDQMGDQAQYKCIEMRSH